MPTLTWVGKDKVVNHHHEVPFRVLNQQYRFDAPADKPANSTNNRIIHGDNLEVLKSLLPEFEGKVNCIYIDPPYNTGNEGWVYNDAVNDPKIKKWLGQVVGKEGEDLSRHDKWLCMMYPRLKLLHRLIATNGVIFVSIDDNEMATLRLLMDEIFGAGNFIATIAWQRRISPDSRLGLSQAHDHIIVFAKNRSMLELHPIPLSAQQTNGFKNPDKDVRGAWVSTDFTAQGWRPNQMYEISTPGGEVFLPPRGRCWANIESVFQQLLNEGRMWFGKDGKGRPRVKTYLSESTGVSAWTWWTNEECGHNQEAKKEIIEILGHDLPFDTPKPTRLIERILQIASNSDSIILDSFAGSGTTAHAVLKLNQQDGGKRRFILIEAMDYAETLTAERVRRVMGGYGEGSKAVAGLGGSFDFYNVGEALFLPDENLNEAVGIAAIRDYVAYTEGIPVSDRCAQDNPYLPHLLGLNTEMAWIFNYETDSVTVLDLNYLAGIKLGAAKPATAIIYADRCLLDDAFMRQHGISFKKIPRDITRF
ncbi:site-specific DNA-methyltransferase [Undibacterium sp. Ren11W]|uniref:site-specific DNA-methyltransferase n=1 Tax=Undibacterium sp. Ren11W TaxID=3413045 RepID=UPI003BF12DCF